MDQQNQWASAMIKAKQQRKKRDRLSIDGERAEIEKKLTRCRQELVTAAETKNFIETKAKYDQLAELRAHQLRLDLEELEQAGNKPDEQTVAKKIAAYKKDCLELALAADKLLGVAD